MQTILATLALLVTTSSCANAPGVSFVGVGYNLLKANPDAGDQSRGGVDPGILTTRRILEITWDEKRQSSDQRYTIPDEVNYHSRSSCVNNSIDDMVTDSKSLQENLKHSIGFNVGGGIPILSQFAFSANPSYQKEVKTDQKEGKVFKKSTKICNLGAARYRSELASAKKYGLSEGFRHAVCALPGKYAKETYIKFLEKWGTHVILEVDVGVKTVKEIENTVGEMFSFASRQIGTGAVKAGGAYQGAALSLELDLNNFKKSETSRKWTKGRITEYAVGTSSQPEPIKLTLEEIDHVLKEEFWASKKAGCDLKVRMSAMKKALADYPKWLNLKEPKHESLKIPITWPSGTYALPQTDRRCPSAKFVWHTGSVTQLTGGGFETRPEKVHFPARAIEKTSHLLRTRYKVTQHFCLKSEKKSTSFAMDWPAGKYCIIKLGDCPTREFEKGSITWDDRSDKPDKSGSLPDGDFSTKGQTRVDYCCRDDGIAMQAVYLPTDKPFYLLRFGGQCQKVYGMEESEEMMKWDEPDLISDTTSNGVHPDNTSKKNIELHYCYYNKKGENAKAKGVKSGLFKFAKGIGKL